MSYITRKIDHLKRVGLVANNSAGIGENGGACPDWLTQAQKELRKEADRKLAASVARAQAALVAAR